MKFKLLKEKFNYEIVDFQPGWDIVKFFKKDENERPHSRHGSLVDRTYINLTDDGRILQKMTVIQKFEEGEEIEFLQSAIYQKVGTYKYPEELQNTVEKYKEEGFEEVDPNVD